MKRIGSVLVVFCVLMYVVARSPQTFDIEGHRGCRGLMPENSIPGFLKALELGVDTIELDVVVSQDRQVVVSHEAFFSSDFTLDPEGNRIPAEKQMQYNLFRMDYAQIRKYDVGSIGNPRFPDQIKVKTHKPLLSEVFRETRKYIDTHRLPKVRYNVEIKSNPAGDGINHPEPKVFARLVYDEILKNRMQSQVMIQSFDVRNLQEFRKYPVKFPLILLVENQEGIERNIERLGFQPDTYSPNFRLVNEQTVAYCRQKGIKIIPWTINEISDLEAMKKFDLDGVITDYPDRAIKVFRDKRGNDSGATGPN
jgi:glycerophosphoryl diester phosphodiesterase